MTDTPSGWTQDGQMLTRSIECEDFKHAVKLINRIADSAEELQHHPEITLKDYKNLTVAITSHESGTLTSKDIELAEKINAIL